MAGTHRVRGKETIDAMRDYFELLRDGYIEEHTAEGWPAFLAGYLAQAAMYAETESPPPPLGRKRRAVERSRVLRFNERG